MQGFDATFDTVSFEGGDGPRRVLYKILPGVAALALAGSLGVGLLYMRPAVVQAPPAASLDAKPFGEILIDKTILAEITPGSSTANLSPFASLEPPPPASIPLPSLDAFPAASPGAAPQAEGPPSPPARDVPEIGDNAPLPPSRPPEFSAPAKPAAPEREVAQPNVAARPAPPQDNRSFLQKLFGWGQPSGQAVANAPPGRITGRTNFGAPEGAAASRTVASASAAPESRSAGRGPLFSFPSPFGWSAPTGGYDRYTAVYDISARTLYLPDGTRLEAHSGLGDKLDNPRYVSERMHGPTPPHLYELALREGSFHGVQALRLNPVGEGGLYGRAGLLAHPYMLGPNGDSNGCVSVKDYDALLRAYENGQVRKLVVVANL